jgi:hypothetical protein
MGVLFGFDCKFLTNKMQPPKVRKTPQKPTICPCGSTANAPKSRGQNTFDAGVPFDKNKRMPNKKNPADRKKRGG